jgi:hypothetical protein
MGPSSVRRDILSKYREEKKALGITKGGRRSRRGVRVAKDSKSGQSDNSIRQAYAKQSKCSSTYYSPRSYVHQDPGFRRHPEPNQ